MRRLVAAASGVSPDVADAALAAALMVLVGAQVALEPPTAPLALYLAFAPLIVLPLAWRRRAPLVVAALSSLALTAQALAAEPAVSFGEFLAMIVAVYSAAAHEERLRALAGGLLCFAATGVHSLRQPDASPFEWVYGLVYFGGAFLVGRAVRRRAARSAEAERRAVGLERARMARELHDVISHSVGVMVVQAGAARMSLPPGADDAQQTLEQVESTGREALAELRVLLGILRADEAEADRAPQPGIAGIGALVEQVRAAGLPVELDLLGERRPLAPGLELSAYRIVQEALTNVRKHAQATRARVVVRFTAEALELEIVDDGPTGHAPASHGYGLTGIRERVSVYSGRVEAGPVEGGGFRVRAWLPVGAAP